MRFFTSFYVIVTAKLVFSSQCQEGYFSEEHKKCISCPEHCQLCDSSTICLYCEDGYWGNICENPCSMCQPKTRCAKPNGFCLEKCKDGYTGSLCDAFCNDKCLNCDKMNASLCDLCALGRYGESCDRRCPGFCDNNACNNSGYCTYGCDSGYWGPKCENNCSGNCNHGSCDTQTGACTYGCKSNFFGNSCERRCPEFCDKNTCNDGGYCTYGCNSGYWGPKCGNNCSSNCKHSSCDTQTGACTYGCKSNFFGSSCDKRCPEFCNNNTCNNSGYCTYGCNSGYWGPRCENSCSSNCKHSSCDTQTGACTYGCPSNFVGSKCDSGNKSEENDEKAANNEKGQTANDEKENEASRQGGEIWPVILIVVVVLIVVVSVVVCVVYRKKLINLRRRGPTRQAEPGALVDIPLIHTMTSEDSGVCSQESLSASLTQDTVVCASHVTVVPPGLLNIRYVDDFSGTMAYIICKDPKNDSEDQEFWELVWQQKCSIIVKLSRNVETTSENKYWPEKEEDKTCGPFIVKNVGITLSDDYRARIFEMKTMTDERKIVQMQFDKWPLDRFPEDKETLLAFRQKVNKFGREDGPLLVHCSEGCGRSNVYVALDMLLEALEKQRCCDMTQLLKKMKTQALIITDEQCDFLRKTRELWKSFSLKAQQAEALKRPMQIKSRNRPSSTDFESTLSE